MDKIFKTLGASNHCSEERETNDYYATNPRAIDRLLEVESLSPQIWECACGEGHLAKQLTLHGYEVIASDKFDRGYGVQADFLHFKVTENQKFFDIVTNPPYTQGEIFVRKALELISPGHKICFFLKLLFLESQGRYKLFKVYPPSRVHVFSSRMECGKNGIFKGTSAVCYAWFIWEKNSSGNFSQACPKITWIK